MIPWILGGMTPWMALWRIGQRHEGTQKKIKPKSWEKVGIIVIFDLVIWNDKVQGPKCKKWRISIKGTKLQGLKYLRPFISFVGSTLNPSLLSSIPSLPSCILLFLTSFNTLICYQLSFWGVWGTRWKFCERKVRNMEI